MLKKSKIFPLLAVAVMLGGCAGVTDAKDSSETMSPKPMSGENMTTPRPGDPARVSNIVLARPPKTAACLVTGQWFDPADTSPDTSVIPMDQLIARMRDKDIVMLGETHVSPDHHRWQLQTIAQLYAQRPDMILGFEAFPRRVQASLKRWVAGELTQQEFLQQSDWDTVWKYDPGLYMELFQFARLNRIPMVALNVDQSLIRAVSKNGWKNVPDTQRLGVGDPAPASPAYLQMLGEVYGLHGQEGKKNGPPKAPARQDPEFARFVDVQLTWDRAMAEAIDSALNLARTAQRDPRVVAIIGSGHVEYAYGVPAQLAALGQTDMAVLSPWDPQRACADLQDARATPVADAVFAIAQSIEPMPAAKPKLGVMIETTPQGVRVNDLVEGSIGAAANLQKGDFIVRAAGVEILAIRDLIGIIQSMTPGTWLPLTVRRGPQSIDLVARFPVPAKPQPHPRQ